MCYYDLKYLPVLTPDDTMIPPFTSRCSPDTKILQIFFSHWKVRY